ncbi:MAG TPA: hypothetical protein VNY83_00530 [Solirubrobacterales bacterium]|jgi:hypothetical protein|nr:hypothetical protein [Solirubrobacterales bacterium]
MAILVRGMGMRVVARLARGAVAGAIVVASVVSGVGVLYLLRDAGVLGFGPLVRGALPLQQLAGGAAQPLPRMALAWIPAGLVAGLALGQLTRLRAAASLAVTAGVSAAMLFVAGGVSDAVAVSDPVRAHLVPQLTRAGTLVAVGLFVGAALVASRRAPP